MRQALVRADAVRQMLGLADRTRVIDLFDAAGARRHRQRVWGISRSNMTSAPIRSWCCPISPNSSISSPA